MAYNINFINPKDSKSQSQAPMLENFTEIQNFIIEDHVDFGDPDQGKHNQLTIPKIQELVDIPSNLSNEFSIFSAIGLQDIIQLFSKDSSGTILPFSMGNFDALNSDGFITLPSGILIKWASFSVPRVLTGLFPLANNPVFGEYIWNDGNNFQDFSNQYWAACFPKFVNIQGRINDFSRSIFYVTDISDPSRVNFVRWAPSIFNNSGGILYLSEQDVFIVGIGTANYEVGT